MTKGYGIEFSSKGGSMEIIYHYYEIAAGISGLEYVEGTITTKLT